MVAYLGQQKTLEGSQQHMVRDTCKTVSVLIATLFK